MKDPAWAHSIRMLRRLGLYDEALAYYCVVGLALGSMPHEVVQNIANEAALKSHELEEAVSVLKARLEVKRLRRSLKRYKSMS